MFPAISARGIMVYCIYCEEEKIPKKSYSDILHLVFVQSRGRVIER
jgi:hypothetical protein